MDKKTLKKIKKDINWEQGWGQGFREGIAYSQKRRASECQSSASDKPSCLNCGKEFVNAIDSKTKKISKHLWRADCECINKKILVSIG